MAATRSRVIWITLVPLPTVLLVLTFKTLKNGDLCKGYSRSACWSDGNQDGFHKKLLGCSINDEAELLTTISIKA
jgi:hypothetical protein